MNVSYLFLAPGFKEIEAIAVVDILRRGGVDVRTVSVGGGNEVTGAHQVTIRADVSLEQIRPEEAECLIFPGGMPGAQHLSECEKLMTILQHHYDQERTVAAICAAPALVLSHLKTNSKLRVTCCPGFEKYLPDYEVVADGVVVDGKMHAVSGAHGVGLCTVERNKGKRPVKRCRCKARDAVGAVRFIAAKLQVVPVSFQGHQRHRFHLPSDRNTPPPAVNRQAVCSHTGSVGHAPDSSSVKVGS